MRTNKIVTIYVHKDILIRLTSNKEDADFLIVPGEQQVCCIKSDKDDIIRYLMENGISTKASGFKYLCNAIEIALKKIRNNQNYTLTGDIYPAIAEKYAVSTCSVDRAMWNALSRSKAKDMTPKKFIEKFILGI